MQYLWTFLLFAVPLLALSEPHDHQHSNEARDSDSALIARAPLVDTLSAPTTDANLATRNENAVQKKEARHLERRVDNPPRARFTCPLCNKYVDDAHAVRRSHWPGKNLWYTCVCPYCGGKLMGLSGRLWKAFME